MSSFKKPANRLVTNRKSPSNERYYIDKYKDLVPASKAKDGKDISAVRDIHGVNGHALLKEGANRSKDGKLHRGECFIPDSLLKNKKH